MIVKHHCRAGTVYQPFELIAIDCQLPDFLAYNIDIETLDVINGPLTRRSLEYETTMNKTVNSSVEGRELAARVLAERADSDANVAYEPSTEDWFGYGGVFNIW